MHHLYNIRDAAKAQKIENVPILISIIYLLVTTISILVYKFVYIDHTIDNNFQQIQTPRLTKRSRIYRKKTETGKNLTSYTGNIVNRYVYRPRKEKNVYVVTYM